MNNPGDALKRAKRASTADKAQARKDELIADLLATRRKILDIASDLPPDKHDQIFLGVWSIKDLAAHLIGWDAANRRAVKAVRAGRLPEFYAYMDRDWQTYNARLVAKYKRDSLAEMIAAMQASHRKLIGVLQALPAGEFQQDTGVRYKGYKVTIARLLQAELKDEKVHYTQVEMFAGQAG